MGSQNHGLVPPPALLLPQSNSFTLSKMPPLNLHFPTFPAGLEPLICAELGFLCKLGADLQCPAQALVYEIHK